jgi:DNA replication initiation complex subunit (GINS family)
MGIFSSIKNAIFGKAKAKPAPQAQPAPRPQAQQQAPAQQQQAPQAQQQAPAQPQQPVDVEQVLTEIAQEKGNPNLNWRTSIVDLMKLLDLDSSLANRKELASELGYAGEKNGSAEMNMWLQKAVMKELEKNGGTVPAGLKD